MKTKSHKKQLIQFLDQVFHIHRLVGTKISKYPVLTFFWRWLPALKVMAMIFWFSSQSYLPGPEKPLLDLIFRKTAHFLVFASLYLTVFRAMVMTFPKKKKIWCWSLVITILYAVSDEVHQSFVPGRNPAILDVIIDSFGAITSLAIIKKFFSQN